MYTSTEESDDEEEADSTKIRYSLPKSMLKTIAITMREIEATLSYAAYIQCQGGSESTGYTNTTSTPSQESRQTFQNNRKRKSRSDDHDEEGANKRRRGSLVTVDSSEIGVRFACPFYKHDPNRYRNQRTCPGPGWQTVHRMKEHLYRAHTQSIYCPRCYSMFDTENDLSNHLRSQQCQVSVPQPIEGIDRETLKTLRKRSPALRLEEDKWRDAYSLLFPDVAEEDIPSPCR